MTERVQNAPYNTRRSVSSCHQTSENRNPPISNATGTTMSPFSPPSYAINSLEIPGVPQESQSGFNSKALYSSEQNDRIRDHLHSTASSIESYRSLFEMGGTSGPTTLVIVDDYNPRTLTNSIYHSLSSSHSPSAIRYTTCLSSPSLVQFDNGGVLHDPPLVSPSTDLMNNYPGLFQNDRSPVLSSLSNVSTTRCYDPTPPPFFSALTPPDEATFLHNSGGVFQNLELQNPLIPKTYRARASDVTGAYLPPNFGAAGVGIPLNQAYSNNYYQHYRPNMQILSSQLPQQVEPPTSVSGGNGVVLPNNDDTDDGYSTHASNSRPKRQVQQRRVQHRPIVVSPDLSVDENSEANSAINYTARTPPETLKWLKENYETKEESSLPRCTLYAHYQQHCMEENLTPVNAASFGKLIRSVFPKLQTRRLGTRGNSKYHYDGIRIKPTSLLSSMISEEEHRRMNPPPGIQRHHREGFRRSTIRRTSNATTTRAAKRAQAELGQSVEEQPPKSLRKNSPHESKKRGNGQFFNKNSSGFNNTMHEFEIKVPEIPIPDLQEMDEFLLPHGLTTQHIIKFTDYYSTCCREVAEHVKNLQFDQIGRVWMEYWNCCSNLGDCCRRHSMDPQIDETLIPNQSISLDRVTLAKLCMLPQIHVYVEKMDIEFYQAILDFLIPNVLQIGFDEKLNQDIRKFAQNIGNWLQEAMRHIPEPMLNLKLTVARLLSNALQRYTSYSHILKAAKEIFADKEIMIQMHQEFCTVDFPSVYAQGEWLCKCNLEIVKAIETQFRENLYNQRSFEEWLQWLKSWVNQIFYKLKDEQIAIQVDQMKRFLVHWNTYGSMVLKEITLRSPKKFGAFHLIKMFSDECLFIIVEHLIAKRVGLPVLSIMSPSWPSNLMSPTNAYQNYSLPAMFPNIERHLVIPPSSQYNSSRPMIANFGEFYETEPISIGSQLTPIQTLPLLGPPTTLCTQPIVYHTHHRLHEGPTFTNGSEIIDTASLPIQTSLNPSVTRTVEIGVDEANSQNSTGIRLSAPPTTYQPGRIASNLGETELDEMLMLETPPETMEKDSEQCEKRSVDKDMDFGKKNDSNATLCSYETEMEVKENSIREIVNEFIVVNSEFVHKPNEENKELETEEGGDMNLITFIENQDNLNNAKYDKKEKAEAESTSFDLINVDSIEIIEPSRSKAKS